MRALRAEEWLMLGVVGIGAYAAYRISKASSAALPAPPAPIGLLMPPTMPPPVMPLPSPPMSSTLQPPPGLNVLSSSSIPLPVAGLGVQGRIETDPPGLLSPASDDASIANAVTVGLGLDNVQVFDNAQLAAALGQPWALQAPGLGTRWFWGRVPPSFSGRTVVRPPWLALAWVSGPPPVAPNIAALR